MAKIEENLLKMDNDYSNHQQNDMVVSVNSDGSEEESVVGDEKITTPFDPTKVRIETRTLTIDLIISRIREGELFLNPEFQRREGLWRDQTQSRLIESILLKIPLPVFYFDGTDDNRWDVVDGLQRLFTLKRFIIDNALRLSSLEFLSNLHNKTYTELPRGFQRRIMETQVTIYLISQGTPLDVKFSIFRRINTSGLPLSAQEIRHALYQGKATRLLLDLLESKEFQQAIDHGVSDNRMGARELILRYFTFRLTPYIDYKAGDFDGFLNEAMKRINEMTDKEIEKLTQSFKRSMNIAYRLLGNEAFRKRYSINDNKRQPINKALFETWSVNLSELNDNEVSILEGKKEKLKEEFILLLNDRKQEPNFDTSISQGTGDVSKVRRRFVEIQQLLRRVISD